MKKLACGGYTVVEVIVSVTVSAILIGVVTTFAMTNLVQIVISNARADLINEAQTALDVVSTDIRLAGSAQLNNRWDDANSPGAPSNQNSWTSDADTLVLASPTENTNGEIIYSDSSRYISQKDDEIYFIDGGVLYKRTVAADEPNNKAKTSCPAAQSGPTCPKDKVLLRNVQSINIKYFNNQDEEVTPPDARSVEVTINLSIRKYGQDVNVTYVTRAVFRNV